MRTGQERLALRDYSRAMLAFRSAAQAMPQDPEPWYQLGVTTLALGDDMSAAKVFAHALELSPKHLKSQLELAKLLARSRDGSTIQAGAEAAKRALAISPDNPEALNILALAEIRSGNAAKAAGQLEDILGRFPKHLETWVNLARAQLVLHDPAGAEQVLRQAIERFPADATALAALGDFYAMTGKAGPAAEYFERSLQMRPDQPSVLMALARLQHTAGKLAEADKNFARLAAHPERRYRFAHALYRFETGRRDEAIAELQQIYKRRPADRDARTYLVNAYIAAGRIPEAEETLKRALADNQKDSSARIQRARILLARGQTDLAEQDLRAAANSTDVAPDAHFLLAQVHQLRGQQHLRHGELREVLRLSPGHIAARTELARALIDNGDPRAALEITNVAPPEQRNDAGLIEQRIWALIQTGAIAEAQTLLDRAIAVTKSPEFVLQDAVLRARRRDFAGAKDGVKQALAARPADVRGLDLAMQIAAAEKRPQEGLDLVRRHAERNPRIAAVQMFLALAEMRTNNRAAARTAFMAVKMLNPADADADLYLSDLDFAEGNIAGVRNRLNSVPDPDRPTVRMRLAAAEEHSGNWEAAVAHYRRVLDTDSRNLVALNNLAYVLSDHLGRVDEALRYAQTAKELAPDNASVDDTLGWVYFQKGLYSAAVRHLRGAVERERSAVRMLHLAMAQAKNGDRLTGQRTLGAALQLNPNLPGAEAARKVVGGAAN